MANKIEVRPGDLYIILDKDVKGRPEGTYALVDFVCAVGTAQECLAYLDGQDSADFVILGDIPDLGISDGCYCRLAPVVD